MNTDKQQVYDYWNKASCGEELYLSGTDQANYVSQSEARYALEGRLIFPFARFAETGGLKVLEIGVGLGAEHQRFAEAGANLYGIDLTERAVEHTRNRLAAFGLNSKLAVGDAENLNFPDESFDLVYSWGVLHHTPDTLKSVTEVHRVIKIGGAARIMIYHKWSMVGYMLWVRYALLRLRPLTSLTEIYARHLESPGTKAYTVREAKHLFKAFSDVQVLTFLGPADLLESNAGQKHRGFALMLARKIWPRWFIRRFMPNAGLAMLIEARK